MNNMTQITLSLSNDQDVQLLLSLAKRLNAEVINVQSAHSLTEANFWQLITLIDLSEQAWNNDTTTQHLTNELSKKNVTDIKQFHDLLAQKLFALDKKEFAQQMAHRYAWQPNKAFSSDHFLYARAYVIARGKVFYEKVLADPTLMPKNEVFEELLYVAATAYEQQTGETFDYVSTVSYETFSNPSGWEQSLAKRLNSST